MRELIERIESCNLCGADQFKDLVNTRSKPYLEFKVYEKWVPGEVKCLFIGESPPGRGFFYDHQTESTLRRNVFSLLGINESSCEGLCEFRRRGLLDAFDLVVVCYRHGLGCSAEQVRVAHPDLYRARQDREGCCPARPDHYALVVVDAV